MRPLFCLHAFDCRPLAVIRSLGDGAVSADLVVTRLAGSQTLVGIGQNGTLGDGLHGFKAAALLGRTIDLISVRVRDLFPAED